MKIKGFIIISLLLFSTIVYAKSNTYQIVGISDLDSYEYLQIVRDYENISPRQLKEVTKPLYPGDAVDINQHDLTIMMNTPEGNTVWFSGMQSIKLPVVNNSWINVKDAIFDVIYPVKIQYNDLLISAEMARFNVAENGDRSIMIQVYEGTVTVTDGSYRRMIIPERYWVIVRPGEPFPEARPLTGQSLQTDYSSFTTTMTGMEKKGSAGYDNGESLTVYPKSAESTEKKPSPQYVEPARNSYIAPSNYNSTASATMAQNNNNYTNSKVAVMPPPVRSANGGSGFLGKMFSSKWFYIGTGMVATGAAGIVYMNKSDGKDKKQPDLTELPGPPTP